MGLAVFFILCGELFLVLMGGVIKHLSLDLAVIQLVFFRNLFGLLYLTPFLLRRQSGGFRTRVLHFHLLRAAAGVCAMFCMFYTYASLQLAEASLLKLLAPVFIPLIAWAWLQEKPGPVLWISLMLSFAGIWVILQPQSTDQTAHLAIALGLGGAVFAGLAKVTIRRLGQTEPSTRIVFYFNLIATLLAAAPAIWFWKPVAAEQWLGIGGLALLATVGQLSSTRAYTLAPAGKVGIYTYASVPIAGVLGWLIWNEALYRELLLGSLLIAAGGILTLTVRR